MIGRSYGVDLGTSAIKIYKKGKGIICDQKNIIALTLILFIKIFLNS